jgi:serine/threonine-protein kinase
MGIVYLAREVAGGRAGALKLLPPELAVRPGLKERFLREARTSARLSHPNIVPIHTVDEADGFVFFAMAFIEGGTLADRMRDRGPPSNAEAIRMLQEVAWALGYAHLQGVVHRDVKPENILLEEGSGRAMVTDFGIAVLAEEADREGPVEIAGTAEFMSPEQAKGAEVDARSDIYSLGCVGFYTLSGRMPFSGSSSATVLGQHLTEPPPLLASVAPQAPPAVAAVIDRCLRKDPEQRFSSGEALAEALSPNTQLERELPLPLRVFIKQTREFESTLAWCGLGLLLFGPPFVAGILTGSIAGAVQAGLVVAVLTGFPLVRLVQQARRLLRSGFTVEDATEALLQDVVRRNEEYRFQVGQRVTWVDRGLKWLKRGGFALAATALLGGTVFSWPVFGVFSASSLTALSATLFQEIRNRARGDVMGERWLRFWKGRLGKGSFKIGSLRLARVAPAVSGIHRPTEVAIGLAADRLFEELPREARKLLRGLPETVKALEDDAQAMRRQVAELDAVLAEIGDDDPTREGAEERARVRGRVAATREEARAKLREAVAALEKIRLGLLYMHAGSGTVETMTTELRAARDLSDDMENLLAGHREVERILQERRKTGMFTIPPGAPGATPGASSGGSA